MLTSSFKLCLGFAVIVAGIGCNSGGSMQDAAGNLAGTLATETTAAADIDRPKYDKQAVLSAYNAFKKRHGDKYSNTPLCLPTADGKFFFFAITGNYVFDDIRKSPAAGHNVGIIDGEGKVIVPTEMDAVYNLGATLDGYWEVLKNGKVGMYDMAGKIAIPVEMDAIYPYKGSSDVLAQVRKGKEFGWADKKGAVHFDKGSNKDAALFQSPIISKLIETWKYDSDNKTLHLFVSLLTDEEYADMPEGGKGVIFTPSYLSKLGILPEIQIGIPVFDEEGNSLIKSTASVDKIQEIDSDTKGFFATLYEEGVDARDYQYDQKVLVTVDDNMQQIDKLKMTEPKTWTCGEELSFRFLNTSLLEVKKNRGGYEEPEYNYTEMTVYSYYSVSPEGKITELKSNRVFAFTKHVKIDESYFKGCYMVTIEEGSDPKAKDGQNAITTGHLSSEDLDVMRNEIFADYGYKFTTEKWAAYFKEKDWYKATHDNVDAMLSEIDKANITVILNMKEKLKKSEAKYLNKAYANYYPAG